MDAPSEIEAPLLRQVSAGAMACAQEEIHSLLPLPERRIHWMMHAGVVKAVLAHEERVVAVYCVVVSGFARFEKQEKRLRLDQPR